MNGVDTVTKEVVLRKLVAMCDEMADHLVATCYSPMIRDVKDFTIGIVNHKGETLSTNSRGTPAHFQEMGERIKHGLEIYGESGFARGDAVMVNHTGITGQHANNVQIYTPIMLGATRLVGFAGCDAHWQDIGGITANRPTGGTIDCYQEGIQVETVKIYKRGQPDQELLRFLAGNLRRPDSSMGDLRAQIASCRTGERRYIELLEEFGEDVVASCMEAIWSDAEDAARAAIEVIPDGRYESSSMLDDDGYDPENCLEIAVSLQVKGSDLYVDLSDLPDQAKGPINSRSNAPVNLAVKALTLPDRPLTLGEFRAVTIECPEGKLMRAHPGAPMGSWSWPFATILDTIFKALEPAISGRIAAGNAGAYYGAGFFFGVHPVSRETFMSLNLVPMGWGGKPSGDGVTAHGLMLLHIQDTPAEVTEALYPLEVERYALRPDSGGPGRYRGGLGVEYVVKALHSTYVSFELDRTRCPAWGLHGGLPGQPGFNRLVLPSGEQVEAPRRAVNLEVEAGTRIVIATGGGGGYGDPKNRPHEDVLADVADGYITEKSAVELYGLPASRLVRIP